jgi:hypothetical protein
MTRLLGVQIHAHGGLEFDGAAFTPADQPTEAGFGVTAVSIHLWNHDSHPDIAVGAFHGPEPTPTGRLFMDDGEGLAASQRKMSTRSLKKWRVLRDGSGMGR